MNLIEKISSLFKPAPVPAPTAKPVYSGYVVYNSTGGFDVFWKSPELGAPDLLGGSTVRLVFNTPRPESERHFVAAQYLGAPAAGLTIRAAYGPDSIQFINMVNGSPAPMPKGIAFEFATIAL